MYVRQLSYVSVRPGDRRSNHGLIVTFKLAQDHFFPDISLKLDVYGLNLFRGFPAGTEHMANMFLPVDIENRDVTVAVVGRTAEVRVGLGLTNVSLGTILEKLNIVSRNGDPLLVVELLAPNREARGIHAVACRAITRASYLLDALAANDDRDVLCYDQKPQALEYLIENRHRPSTLGRVYSWVRWWILAVLFAIGCWLLWLDPLLVEQNMPKSGLFSNKTDVLSLEDSLPPVPKTMGQAFQLGILNQRLNILEDQKEPVDSASIQSLLVEAAKVLSRRVPITASDLHTMDSRINQFETQQGLASRVHGLMSFVNVIWLVAIVGVVVSIGPALVHVLSPLRRLFAQFLTWLFTNVLLPVCERCHRWGVFEALCWVIAWFFVLDGHRFFLPATGTYVSLTGCLLAIPAFSYSTFLHGSRIALQLPRDVLSNIASLWYAVATLPLAIVFQSSLLGYISVAAFYSAIGFSFACFGLCYFIGFASDSAIQRIIVTSTLLLALFSTLKVFAIGQNSMVLAPLRGPVSVFGSLTLFLGLLILSSRYHRSFNLPYFHRNALMVVALVVVLFVGFVYGMPGMANTGVTFLCLWLLEKYIELYDAMKFNFWILVLSVSVVMYKTALYLHANPSFMSSLFSNEIV